MSSFLNWCGGSGVAICNFSDYFPNIDKCKGYIEPFLGAGNTFFYLMANYSSLMEKPIYLSDLNHELVKTYKVVRDIDKLTALLGSLEKHRIYNSADYYYMLRDRFPVQEWNDIEKAAAFIYLTRAAFGSLWRVNSIGKMNTAYCRKLNVETIDQDLRNGHYAYWLKNAKLNAMSFENILNIKNIEEYFVFLDPPFYSINGGDNFTGYTKYGFHLSKRMLLPGVFKELDNKGCKVMMRNSDSPATHRYFKDYNINMIKTNRKTGVSWSNVKKEDSNNVYNLSEVIVSNYDTPKKQMSIDDAWS
jgi:DNA adenine methylase